MKLPLKTLLLLFVAVSTPVSAQEILPALKTPFPTFSAQNIPIQCRATLGRAKAEQARLRTTSPASNYLEKWNDLALSLDTLGGQMGLLSNVSPDKNIRMVAEKCLLDLSLFNMDLQQDTALYSRLQQVEVIDAIDEKYKNDLILGFQRAGAALAPKDRLLFKKLSARSEEIQQEFTRNLRDNQSKVLMSAAEMQGLPDIYMKAQKQNKDGLYELGFEYPQYIPFMTYARTDAARKRYYMAFQNRGGDKNAVILDELVTLRTKMAQLLGYKAYADFALQTHMAKTPETVNQFLLQVRDTVTQGEKSELDQIQAFRAAQEKIPVANAKLDRWNMSYWENAYKQAHFNIDQEALRGYLLTEPTVNWALSMTADLYGVSLRPRKVPVWDKEVKYFDVVDKRANQVISGIFLDLYPREGKYDHAAAFPIQGSSSLAGQPPISALVTNFDRRGLNWDELNTLLHEFGHVMHGVLSNTRYAEQSGTSVERDFVEATSQMYEEWGHRFETLQNLSATCPACKPFTPQLVTQINRAEKFGKGIFYARQWLYAAYDMALYSAPYAQKPLGALSLWNKMEEATVLGHVPGTQFPGNFEHIVGNYASGYYGYMWSKVIALDMQSVFGDRLLNPKLGQAFRELVLSQGSQQKGGDLAKDFLGRDPTPDAFIREISGQ